MADVLTMLQQFLCYGNTACAQEFQQYAYKPMEGIFYAVFFPIVFILLFVYIVSGAVGALRAKGFRILIAVAVFAFIILEGWYHFFLVIGRLWLYVIIFLGFIWVLIHTFTGRGGGEGGNAKARTGGGSIGGALTKRIKNQMTGKVNSVKNALERALVVAEGIIGRVNHGDTQAYRGISAAIMSVEEALKAYREIVSVEGFTGGDYKQMEERANEIIQKLSSSRTKYEKKHQF